MSKEEKKIAEPSYVASPIAARLAAESGWRAVVFRTTREMENEGMREVSIEVVTLVSWAIDAPRLVPPKPEHAGVLGSSGGAVMFHPWGATSLSLWPIDPRTDRKFGEELHRLVPPCDDTDAQLVDAAKLWCAESVEKSKPAIP